VDHGISVARCWKSRTPSIHRAVKWPSQRSTPAAALSTDCPAASLYTVSCFHCFCSSRPNADKCFAEDVLKRPLHALQACAQIACRRQMSEHAESHHQSPQDTKQDVGPAPPPKQRFKQALAQSQSQPPLAGAKRPLPSPTPTGDGTVGNGVDNPVEEHHTTDGDAETSEHAEKQPRIVPSIIKGVGVFHKPRVGAEFQAAIPDLRPRP